MRLTDGMRWCIVGTLCFVLFLLTVGGLTQLPGDSDMHAGCRGHGGVVRSIDGADNIPRHVACRDGTIVDL